MHHICQYQNSGPLRLPKIRQNVSHRSIVPMGCVHLLYLLLKHKLRIETCDKCAFCDAWGNAGYFICEAFHYYVVDIIE